MRSQIVLLMAVGLSVGYGEATAQNEAEVKAFSLSLHFSAASVGGLGLETTLTLGTTAVNGEVAPGGTPYSHFSGFQLAQPGMRFGGQIRFDIPRYVDANGNGIHDFFEVAQRVASTITSGAYVAMDGFDAGSVTATWSRGADSPLGTCRLSLVSDTFGELPTFDHTFELILSDLSDGMTVTPPLLQLEWREGEWWLTLTGTPGAQYQIQFTPSLINPQWIDSVTVSLDAGRSKQTVLPDPGHDSGFWRAAWNP